MCRSGDKIFKPVAGAVKANQEALDFCLGKDSECIFSYTHVLVVDRSGKKKARCVFALEPGDRLV